jgi:hypothetical protein
MGRGPWSQAERDDITVEIGYAVFTAALLGGVAFAAIAGPAALWRLPSAVERSLVLAGGVVAGVLAMIRIASVLLRHARHLRERH